MAKKKVVRSRRGFGKPTHSLKSGLAVVNQYLAKNQPQKAIKEFQELESLST